MSANQLSSQTGSQPLRTGKKRDREELNAANKKISELEAALKWGESLNKRLQKECEEAVADAQKLRRDCWVLSESNAELRENVKGGLRELLKGMDFSCQECGFNPLSDDKEDE